MGSLILEKKFFCLNLFLNAIKNKKVTPTAADLGFVIGPQLNAASRVDDSSLPSKLLISDDKSEIEKISRKLILFNEKRVLL